MKLTNLSRFVMTSVLAAVVAWIMFLTLGNASKPNNPKVDLSHPKVLEYSLVVKFQNDSEYFAIAMHHSVPDGVLKAVLEASTPHQALRASGDYPVIVRLGDTPRQALNAVAESIVKSPVLQTTQ